MLRTFGYMFIIMKPGKVYTKNNIWTLLFLLCAILLFISCNRRDERDSKKIAKAQNYKKFNDTKIEKDTKFAVEIADNGLLKIRLAELALYNTSSKKIMEFVQSIEKDHFKTNEELKGLAAKKHITLPSSLSYKSKKKYDELAEKKGEDFDEAYCDFIIKCHKNDLDAFKKESDDGKDPDLKSWASEKLPILQHHLSMAERVGNADRNESR